MSVLRVRGGVPLRGRVRVPIDVEVAQHALLMAALAEGTSELPAIPPGSEADELLNALCALGVRARPGPVLELDGVGVDGLQMPSGAIDCGSAWLGLALCTGLISGQRFGTRLTVHPSLSGRSVEALVGPLRARGAHVAARSDAGGALVPPVAVAPLVEGESLRALDCSLSAADAAVKAGVLVSGLYAAGPTTLAEPFVSADHLERLFVGLGLPLRRIGSIAAFDPGAWDRRVPVQRSSELPGSATAAAYLAAVAQAIPGSDIELEGAGINPTRSGVLDVLRSWGADLVVEPQGDASVREPVGGVRLRSRGLRGGVLGAEELVRSRDALAALALVGAVSRRGVQLFDLHVLPSEIGRELQVLLQAFGIEAELDLERLRVPPGLRAPPSVRVDARDDAERALAALALGLASSTETVLEHAADALARSHPGFIETAQALGADIDYA